MGVLIKNFNKQDKSAKAVTKGFETLKSGVGSAWGFLKTKIQDPKQKDI